MRTLRPTSIIVGVLADKVLFVAAIIPIATSVGLESRAFPTIALAVGFASTFCGALLAAWHARQTYLLHGIAVGAVALLISFLRYTVNSVRPPAAAAIHPLNWELLAWCAALLAGLVGGGLAQSFAARIAVPRSPRPDNPKWSVWLPVLLLIIALFALLEQL